MWKRRIILLVCFAALALGVWQLWVWRERTLEQQHETYLRQIDDVDAYKRLLAAEGLLRRDPANVPHRLVRTKALMELNRHAEAREELQTLIDQGAPGLQEYVTLQITSFFAETEKFVGGADRQRSESVVERVEALMSGVEVQAKLITGKDREFPLLLIDARRLDALVSVYRYSLESKRVDLTKARIGGIQQTVETIGLEVSELETKIAKLDATLIAACGKLMQMQPSHPHPIELLFHCHLRRGEFEQARSLARMLATWESIPSETVAKVADELLNLETMYGEPVTKEDVELAGKLLQMPGQTGTPSMRHRLATGSYAIELGDAEAAKKIAYSILAEEWLHARALCIAARSFILEKNPTRAIEILQKYTELKREPLVRYTLGLAYLSSGEPRQINLGQEALRQCLEIEPNHLPARLKLIESLGTSGYILEAADDVQVVEQLSPRHPRVLALKVQLAVATEDLGTLATLIDQQLTNQLTVLRASDVALVIGMVVDDVPRVLRHSKELAAAQPTDIFVLIAERWAKLDPIRRGRLSPVVARSLVSYMDRDPMRSPLRPAVPKLGSMAVATTSESPVANQPLEPLTTSHFLPRPIPIALQLAELGIDQWPLTPSLISAGLELNIWLNRVSQAREWLRRFPPTEQPAEDSLEAVMKLYLDGDFENLTKRIAEARIKNHGALTPTHRWLDLDLAVRSQDSKLISERLMAMLQVHPWAEPALAMVVIDAMHRDQPDRAFATLGMVEQANPQLANLTRARLNLGLGRAADAMHDVDKVVANENAGTELRRWAAEVRARAHLLLDQQPLAVGVFDQLATTLTEHNLEAAQAAADVLICLGKGTAAAEVVSEYVSKSDIPHRMVDQLLARAELVMKPGRVRAIVDTLLTYRANDPLLMLYQARAIAHEDDVVAERVIKSVIARHPQAPRAMMEMAELLRTIQPDETRRIYSELTKRGGRTGEAAQRLLDAMNGKGGTTPSSSASVEGFPE